MKIRWSRNSVRFRITPAELESLQQSRPINEALGSGDGYWQATIAIDEARQFRFEQMNLQIHLAPDDVAELAMPEVEGVYFTTDNDPKIRYLIEKDFPCAHPRTGQAAETVTETFAPTPDFERRKQQN